MITRKSEYDCAPNIEEYPISSFPTKNVGVMKKKATKCNNDSFQSCCKTGAILNPKTMI